MLDDILRYLGICLEEWEISQKILSWDSCCTSRDSNHEPHYLQIMIHHWYYAYRNIITATADVSKLQTEKKQRDMHLKDSDRELEGYRLQGCAVLTEMNARPGSACPNINVCQDIGGGRVFSTTGALCCSHACLHNCLTEVRILSKIPGFTRISWYAFDTRSNTSKPLIGPEYTKVLIVSTARYQVNWKQQLAQSVRPIHWLPRVWFRYWQCKKMRWCPIMHEIHVLFSMNKQIFQEYWYIIRKPMVYCTCWFVRQINWSICSHSAL